jgi:hypothetical protein
MSQGQRPVFVHCICLLVVDGGSRSTEAAYRGGVPAPCSALTVMDMLYWLLVCLGLTRVVLPADTCMHHCHVAVAVCLVPVVW